MRRPTFLAAIGLFLLAGPGRATAADPPPLADYFRIETEKIASKPLLGITSAGAWKAARPELQRQFRAMLGLDPWPERTPLAAVVTGTLERPDFVVEKILFQSSPGLYVTGNLYRPKKVDKPLPAVLYVCGHALVEKDGVILGCKTHYQHHPEWYASNGFVCFIVDTIQLGELPGIHHGTSRFGMWRWPARGYTPAGIEAWNGVRSIDYLLTRDDVDKTKIGVTGRSGGGATSWWLGAIDDRISAVIPVAGITDLKNHVVDGAVEGHCDCMYHVNAERWDFDTVAALVAPKALLVENTDHDSIFPEDGVRRIYGRLEQVYKWYDASDRLGLVIGKGGHADTVELRHPSFAFMNKWLKAVESSVVEPNRKIPDELLTVVLDNRPPADNLNPVIHERFFTAPAAIPSLLKAERRDRLSEAIRTRLRRKVFAGWPTEKEAGEPDVKVVAERTQSAMKIREYEFASQPGIRLCFWTIERAEGGASSTKASVIAADEDSWRTVWSSILPTSATRRPLPTGDAHPTWQQVRNQVLGGETVVVIVPRGVGPTAWPIEKDKHIRRRFMLLGQTLDGMRAWDVRRAIAAWRNLGGGGRDVSYLGTADASTWLLWALAMTPESSGTVVLTKPPTTVRDGPAYLNLETVLEMPTAVELLHPRPVVLRETPPAAWPWTRIPEARAWIRIE